ncbi:MAG: nickel pincer cofactor biosynthesis protein LarC [Syntrophobacteraceae bacterium]|jgi:hypothetical protein|nr:nickel pincer cofactor biosynthesis protein LarC [Syntrophobacteraceae bacterium]
MRTAYFDCFSGASGDMILGAMLDAGLDLETLRCELAKLPIHDFSIEVQPVNRAGIGGSLATVVCGESHHHAHRHLRDLEAIVQGSGLAPVIQEKCLSIFRRLAESEARVHRTSVDAVHFHEVGALDTIVDVVGAVAGLELLGIERICCSPLNVGGGTVRCAHGELPVPAPATAELTKGIPVYSSGLRAELLTPTGAAILTSLAIDFGPLPTMVVERIGYGAGRKELPVPNLLRLLIGESQPGMAGLEHDSVAFLEANIDDMNPELYDFVMERLFGAGALDVTLTPVQMKKNRPATLISAMCPVYKKEDCIQVLLCETTTIGVRWSLSHRLKARREIHEVRTSYGVVRCKVAWGPGEMLNVAPEYEDCVRLARETKIPLKRIMEEARHLAQQERSRVTPSA